MTAMTVKDIDGRGGVHPSLARWVEGAEARAPRVTTELRRQLAANPVRAAGCFDALSARIAEDVGFRALHVTGSGVESTQLGAPDLGLMTLTELAGHVGRIAAATSAPIICDVDTGFGGVDNVMRTIVEMTRAGVAGVHLEDQLMPKCSPTLPGRRLLSRSEAVGRVQAALAARPDPDFVIVARSDADAISFEELVRRCNLYLEAGADLAFPMLMTYDDVPLRSLSVDDQLRVHERLVREIDGPLLGMAFPRRGEPTVQQMVDVGLSVVIMPTTSLQAAASAMKRVLRDLHDAGDVSGYFDREPDEFPTPKLYELLGQSRYLDHHRRFGGSEEDS